MSKSVSHPISKKSPHGFAENWNLREFRSAILEDKIESLLEEGREPGWKAPTHTTNSRQKLVAVQRRVHEGDKGQAKRRGGR